MAGITFAPRERSLMDFSIDPRALLASVDRQAIKPLMSAKPTPKDVQAYYAGQIQNLVKSDALDAEMKAKIGQLNINTPATEEMKRPLLPNDPPRIDSYKEFIPDTKYTTPPMTNPVAPDWTKSKPVNTVPIDIAKGLDVPNKIPTDHPDFLDAVNNTNGAKITPDGLVIDVTRHQKSDQGQMPSVRTGVFYLPSSKSPQEKYYRGKSTGAGYGGDTKIQGTTLVKNPFIVKAGTGGNGPAKAYDSILGKGSHDKMRSAVIQKLLPYERKATAQEVAEVLKEFGGSPEMADDIVQYSREGNKLPYAVQENIIANVVRNAGHDSILAYSKGKSGNFLSELFDLRESDYPDEFGHFSLHDKFQK